MKNVLEFFDVDGSVHRKFVSPGQSITGHSYVQVLQMLRDAVWRKRPDKGHGQRFLYYDNVPSNTSFVVQQCLFPTLKMSLKGTRFATMKHVKSNGTAELQKIPKETFHRCFQ
jgi:hypothetical protein